VRSSDNNLLYIVLIINRQQRISSLDVDILISSNSGSPVIARIGEAVRDTLSGVKCNVLLPLPHASNMSLRIVY